MLNTPVTYRPETGWTAHVPMGMPEWTKKSFAEHVFKVNHDRMLAATGIKRKMLEHALKDLRERGSGWYSLALTTSHTDTLGDLAIHATASGADPVDLVCQVVAYDPTDATALGLSRLDAAVSSRMATFTLPTNFSAFSITAAGRVDVAAVAGTAQTARDLGANLDVAVSTRLASASYAAPDNASISAIKTKTDSLSFTVSGQVDANAYYIKGQAINGAGTEADPWRP